jgi:oxygen-dependent protoporphyrinogen oxidase
MATDPSRFPLPQERAIVVGAGIAGMTAAYRLRQRGFDVTVLEATDYIGGKMSSLQVDGFTLNRGATLLPTSYTEVKSLITELGLMDQISEFPAVIAIPREGQVHRLRVPGVGAAVDGLTTKLISPKSKLKLGRLAMDAFRVRKALSYSDVGKLATIDTETIGEYAGRQLNREILEYVIDPITRGLYMTDADPLSVAEVFFSASKVLGSGFMRYPGGIHFLNMALAERVRDVRTGAAVRSVERDDAGVTITWDQGGREQTERVAGCVIATPGHVLPSIYPQLDARQRDILTDEIRYVSCIVIHHALHTRPADPATVMSIPRGEDDGLGIIVFGHQNSTTAVPAEKGLVSSYWMDSYSVANADLRDEELLEKTLPAVEKFIPGLSNLVEFNYVQRWKQGWVRTTAGTYRSMAEFTRRMDPSHRVQVAGDFLTIPGTNGSLSTGDNAARRLCGAVLGT